ncbi:MAG TPA: aminodeoxychorismate synthase component I [Geminicoccus sp.]|jgi:para-aminobenzoate synthetase|uniref:aminodeoxychorismate synthase component I n=1 Tax=Geminicoccus sp. TaxID=2024832 RepID=UPI002E2F2977|nr:aminodeoxychorismate synthase component I [Geminicoccus sp.]HEX2528842.1 aminodeoxychorismate synthase component I [Geminicoccus sp.]
MRILLVDNYDSFTFNLAQLVGEVCGCPPLVVKNDEVTMAEVLAIDPDAIIISPGPGRPDVESDFGIGGALIRFFDRPILGVCLGHQGIAAHLGGRIDYAPAVMHGRPSRIIHTGTGLFVGLPQDFQAVRYHSLLVTDPGPALKATAWTEDGVIMALRHRQRPLFGVQFHPESISSEHGGRLVRNFLELVDARPSRLGPVPLKAPKPDGAQRTSEFRIFSRTIDCFAEPERAFAALFGTAEHAFWLDSAADDSCHSQWSFMGDASGPWAELISCSVQEGIARNLEVEDGTIFAALARWLAQRGMARPAGLDVPFLPGWVGYFGYELKASAGAFAPHHSDLPDAQFLLADRIVAFDHLDRRIVLVALDLAVQGARVEKWFADTIEGLATAPDLAPPPPPALPLFFAPRLDDRAYLRRIRLAKEAIRRGESYEVCLTNQFVAHGSVDPFPAYRRLRAGNPAPFAAFLRFGELSVLSSSPERFLKIGHDRVVEARPIKGTIGRGQDQQEDAALAERLRSSVKDRSEHLMIVDLLRNDLGRVCEVGSVHVPDLFAIESYATVHQMVSTIRGKLADGISPIDCIQAAFPGGSMTGAPKLRTMEILDGLEGGPRGIYSGAIGYVGLDGSVDLSITIRTAVCHRGQVRIGAGGAIIDLSDPMEELAEVRLKCRALMEALGGTIERQRNMDANAELAIPPG